MDKVLNGANLGTSPSRSRPKFELVISLKHARALGLKIRQSILVSANRVFRL